MRFRHLVLTVLLCMWACLPAEAQGRGEGASNGVGGGAASDNGHGDNGNGAKGNGKGDKNNGKDNNSNSNGDDVTADDLEPELAVELTEPLGDQPRMRLRHENGFEEILSGGRYYLKDNQGRSIVNRPATQADLTRLRYLTGR